MSDATLWEGEVHDGPKCYERMWVNEYGTMMLGYSYTWEKWQSRSHYEVAADPLAAHLATALAAREVELAALRAAALAYMWESKTDPASRWPSTQALRDRFIALLQPTPDDEVPP